MTGYKIPFISTPQQKELPKEVKISGRELSDCKEAINKLLEKGAVSKCMPKYGQFLSPYFLAEKPNGEKRFILNLKKLNEFLVPPHFKLEDKKTVMRILSKDSYLATLDLKDAYLTIPVSKSSRKFLRFKFENNIYEFTCIPFGLCTAPFLFTKLMKPVIHSLRSKSFLSVIYLDDFLLMGKTKEECTENMKITRKVVERLGLVVNEEKSSFEPSKVVKFLGFEWDSEKMSIRLTIEKKQNISSFALKLCRKSMCKIRDMAQFIGTLVAACPAVPYGLLYTKILEREKYLSLIEHEGNFNEKMIISPAMQTDIQWWIDKILSAENPIRSPNYKIEIFTDASLSGWGASSMGESTHGWWDRQQQESHINYLELLAAFYGLKCFAKDLQSCQILLRIDNTTAIAYINRMGSIQFPKLSSLCREIWQWCERRNLWIFASYIPSRENTIADKESRQLPFETEWELAPWAFNKIISTFDYFEIDLFASNINKKCNRFVSWKKDPDAWAIDAFTINWVNKRFYAFPPFSLVLRTLQKIANDEADGVVVVPFWPTQPWFPLFKKMLVCKPIYLGPHTNLLMCPFREIHPLAQKLTLVVGKVSGRLSQDEECQKNPCQ